MSNEKCLACHKGSLYQHGGNRIDSVDLCVTCHNPASNDKNWRDSYGVTAPNSYDGKAGETYDLRTMVHAIHSSGDTAMPWVIYRGNNGVYAFGSQAALDALPNWPTVTPFPVFPGLNATARSHTKIVVHYPRPLNDCNACHVGGSQSGFGDQAERMAVTMAADAVVVSGVDGQWRRREVGHPDRRRPPWRRRSELHHLPPVRATFRLWRRDGDAGRNPGPREQLRLDAEGTCRAAWRRALSVPGPRHHHQLRDLRVLRMPVVR